MVIAGLLLAAAASAGVAVFWASKQAPEFYFEAVRQAPEAQREASEQMLAGATALASNLLKQGHWHALFTADEINGWLAVDLPENHPNLLGSAITEPRVRIDTDRLTVACQYDDGQWASVVSLDLEVHLVEPDTLAIEFRGMRAGKVPLPMTQLLEAITRGAEQLDLRVKWQSRGSLPVALITLPAAIDDAKAYRLEAIELRPGEVYLAGITESASALSEGEGVDADQVAQSLEKLKRQR